MMNQNLADDNKKADIPKIKNNKRSRNLKQ